MAIQTSCSCGRRLVLRDELAGKVIRCPQCARELAVTSAPAAPAGAAAGGVAYPPPYAPPYAAPEEELVEVAPVIEVELPAAVPPPLPPRSPSLPGSLEVPPPAPQVPPNMGPGYGAAPPPVVKRAALPRLKKKKKSLYEEFYGNEPGHSAYAEDWFGAGLGGVVVGAMAILASIALFFLLWGLGVVWVGGIIMAVTWFIVILIVIIKGVPD